MRINGQFWQFYNTKKSISDPMACERGFDPGAPLPTVRQLRGEDFASKWCLPSKMASGNNNCRQEIRQRRRPKGKI